MATVVDVLYLTDLRFPGGTSSSLVEEVRAAADGGYRIGAIQMESSSLRADRTFQEGVQRLLDDGALELIRPGESVRCGLAIVKHPTVFVESVGGRLPVEADRVIVVVGQVPADANGTRYYEPDEVHEHVVEAFGTSPTWWPVSPIVRAHLEGSGVLLSNDDWVEVIDVDAWRVARTGSVGPEPVIGRHGRPSRLKWPSDPAELLAAYPSDSGVRVRVLGGADGLEEVVSTVPDRWEVLPFGSMPAQEFLAGIDFFVYFHHPDLVEAFGRTVLEALAAGCVVILPPHFEELFGDACIYVEASEVRGVVDELYADGLSRRSAAGVEEVVERFSHQVHLARLEAMTGAPTGAAGRTPPSAGGSGGLADRRPRTLVSCIGASAESTARVIEWLTIHRDRATGFTPVVVCTAEVPAVASHLAEEVLLSPRNRSFATSIGGVVVETVVARGTHQGDERWEDMVLRRLGEMVRRHQIDNVMVADVSDDDAWLALQVRT